jgi:hypothetical protein
MACRERPGRRSRGSIPTRKESNGPKHARRERKAPLSLSYQQAPLDDLPHESNVFDAGLAEPLLSSAADPERAWPS